MYLTEEARIAYLYSVGRAHCWQNAACHASLGRGLDARQIGMSDQIAEVFL